MTDDEMMQLKDGDRVVVRWRGNEIPGSLLEGPLDLRDHGIGVEVGVVLDGGLGDEGEGEPTTFFGDDVLRRAERGEGLVRIGDAFYRQADTIFAEQADTIFAEED